MTLHDAEIVQWQRCDKSWQRARIVRNEAKSPIAYDINGEPFWLVRHGLSGDLEFVCKSWLQVQPEEHPE